MKQIAILLLVLLTIIPVFSQDPNEGSTANDKTNLKTTRQGFGQYRGLDMGLGFVNGQMRTDGSAYYFDNWDTEGAIYVKDQGKVKIEKVNINLYNNTLEALYDGNNVFTFDSDNLFRIVINDTVFRIIEVDSEPKIFELFFKGNFSVYRYFDVSYSKGAADPMLNRRSNKYIKKDSYYLYKNGKLIQIKLSRKSVASALQSDNVSQEAITEFIKENNLSMKDEADLTKVFQFVNKLNIE